MSSSMNKTPTANLLSSPSTWRSVLSLHNQRRGGDTGGGRGAGAGGRPSNKSLLAFRRQASEEDDGGAGPRNLRAFSTSPRSHGGAGGGPNRNTTSAPTNTTSSNSSNKTPFLTLVLLKLDGLLDEYCLLLSHPSYKNAVQASVLMETCIATATTTTTSSTSIPSSPNIHHQQHQHQHHHQLSSPSPSRIMGAALSSLLLTRSPNTHHQKGSPMDSPSNHSTGSAGSSLRNWLQQASSSSDHHHHHHHSSSPSSSSPFLLSQSAMALEGEWETYQRPFLLLAAALVLYMDMQHVHNNNNNSSSDTLQGLFQYLATEFQVMEQALCGPFLDMMMMMVPTTTKTTTTTTTTTSNSHSNNSGKYHMAAKHVAQTLRTLVAMCQSRCHLITLQCSLFLGVEMSSLSSSWSSSLSFRHDLEDSKTALAVVCSMTRTAMQAVNIISGGDGGGGGGGGGGANDQGGESAKTAPISSCPCPLGEALLQELDTWTHCLNAAAGLEACQFFDSIVSLAQFKQSLPLPSSAPPQDSTTTTTRLDEWFQKTHKDLTSLLPVYFDRVAAFAGPLYGFEAQVHNNNNNNINATTTTTTSAIMSSPPPLSSSTSAKNSSSNNTSEEDWNFMVSELLRRQDRLGGPPTAVALVLDAVGTNNLHVERGFQLSSATKNSTIPPPRVSGSNDMGIIDGSSEEQQQQAPNDNSTISTHILWPAIYLRSTTQLKNVTHVANSINFSSSRTSLVSSNSVRGPAGGFLLAGGFDWSTSSSSQDIINENSSINNAAKYQKTGALTSSSVRRASTSSFAANHARSSHSMSSHINLSVLEYEPDAGKASSWPHTEWDSLVNTSLTAHHHHHHHHHHHAHDRLGPPPIPGAAAAGGGDGSTRHTALPRMIQEPIAVTYREDDDDQVPHHHQHDQSSTSLLSEGAAGLFRASSALSSSDQLSLLPVVSFPGNVDDNKSKRHNTSAFHVVSLSRYISLVVIVKGDNVEESRFLRRRSRVADEDIRAFLDHWAQKLRVSNRFTRSFLMALPKAKKACKEISPLEFSNPPNVTVTSTAPAPTTPAAWTATRVQTYFKQVKDAFGLRPTSPIHGSASRVRSFGRGRSNSSSNRGSRSPFFGSKSSFLSSPRTLSDLHAAAKELNGNIQKSVDLLFLGPELAQVIEYD